MNGTTITDIRIPFGRMVAILLKWMLASIPAILLLYAVLAAISLVLLLVVIGSGIGLESLLQDRPTAISGPEPAPPELMEQAPTSERPTLNAAEPYQADRETN
ncbi:MAG: hypothetical protein AAGA96_05250 [Verrucomicrobiota bacterium]